MPFCQGIGKTITEVQTGSRSKSLAVFHPRLHRSSCKPVIYGRNQDAEISKECIQIGNRSMPISLPDPAPKNCTGLDVIHRRYQTRRIRLESIHALRRFHLIEEDRYDR